MVTDGQVRIEPLGSGRRILVSRSHGFGTDAFLLASFASPSPRENAVDLGTGCGIIPTLWLGAKTVRTALGIEISAEACELAQRTIDTNGDGVRFEVLNMDMRQLEGSDVEREHFDLVCCNPPYFVENSGYVSPDPERARARADADCTLEDVCAAAAYLLRWGGRLCMCCRPERLCDLFCAMRASGIEPKKLRLCQQRPEKAPWLALVEGRRGGKPTLDILPPLLMLDEKGESSAEVEAIYGCYREGRRSDK